MNRWAGSVKGTIARVGRPYGLSRSPSCSGPWRQMGLATLGQLGLDTRRRRGRRQTYSVTLGSSRMLSNAQADCRIGFWSSRCVVTVNMTSPRFQ